MGSHHLLSCSILSSMRDWPLTLGGYSGQQREGAGVPAGNWGWPRPHNPPGVLRGQDLEGLLHPSPESKRTLDPNYRKWLGQPSPCMIQAPRMAAD